MTASIRIISCLSDEMYVADLRIEKNQIQIEVYCY